MDRWTISIHNPELLTEGWMDRWTISIHNPELLIVAYRGRDGQMDNINT